VRVLVVAAAVFGSAVVSAVVLAVVDLYLTGHALPSIGTEILTVTQLGVHLSVSDLVMLGAMVLAGTIAWRATRHDSHDRR
jgi:hypothetical protein